MQGEEVAETFKELQINSGKSIIIFKDYNKKIVLDPWVIHDKNC